MNRTSKPTRWAAALAVPALGISLVATAATGADAPQKAQAVQHQAHATSATRLQPPVPTLPRPEDFVLHVTNRYLPWIPGTKWIYTSETPNGHERVVTTVTTQTKQILGITATVVHDRGTLDGKLIENTFDWYAQDRNGNVWYLGEDTTSYDHGQTSTEGSWEAGVDGARAGVAMFAQPQLGVPYRQEYLAGQAEDLGKVLDRSTVVTVKAGSYDQVVMTEDTSALEPDVAEYKFYAPGVGVVLEFDASPDQASTQLVRMVKP